MKLAEKMIQAAKKEEADPEFSEMVFDSLRKHKQEKEKQEKRKKRKWWIW